MPEQYRCFVVTRPGQFEMQLRPIPEPGPGQVRLRVEACGVCHSDSATVQAEFPGLEFPRVPGHEVVGCIDAVGAGVSEWKTGQRVGVGFLGGQDGDCPRCRRGDFVNCTHPEITGITRDGGYAEMMLAEARGISAIPDGLSAVAAAPLLCAGLTTFNALRNANLRAGDTVAIHGLGGLGHLAVQFSRRMGYRTIAVGRGADKASLARELGAHQYIDADAEDTARRLQSMGGAQAILATAPAAEAISDLLAGLASAGTLLVVSVPLERIPISAASLVFGERTVKGSLTGRTVEQEDTLRFSTLQGVMPMVETMPFEQAPAAYARMMRGEARFRIVLTMSH